MCKTALLAVLLLLSARAPLLHADLLSDPPPTATVMLTPVPVIDLGALDADSHAQLDAARARAAQALAALAGSAELADAYGQLGALYQVHFVFSPARACYDNAMRLAPGEFRWLYYSAYLDTGIGELERAIDGYERARRLRPGYLALTLRLADARRELDELEQAEQDYRTVLDAEGLQAAAHYGLGQIALLRHDHAQAIAHLQQVLTLQPAATRVHYSLAQALRATGAREEAEQHLAQMGDTLPTFTDPQIESLLALRQGSHVHFIRAMQASRKQDFAAAREAFAAGLEREPDNVNARISLARTLYLTGDRMLARQALETALQHDPSSALAHFLLGVLAEEDEDLENATRHYKAALRHDPQHSGAHLYLGNVHYRAGQMELAAHHYAHSSAAATDNPGAWLALCGVRLQTGQPEQARALLLEARSRFPDLPVLDHLLIQLQALSGDSGLVSRARSAADELVARQDIPPHRELQALTLAAGGDPETAAIVTQALATEALWGMPAEGARLERIASGYREGRLPAVTDLSTYTLLQPPPLQGRAVFLDYPAPRPY